MEGQPMQHGLVILPTAHTEMTLADPRHTVSADSVRTNKLAFLMNTNASTLEKNTDEDATLPHPDDNLSLKMQTVLTPPVSSSDNGINGGRWTKAEHQSFLVGLNLYGREWKKVAMHIETRTSAQIRSHAQKYFAKLAKKGRFPFPEPPGVNTSDIDDGIDDDAMLAFVNNRNTQTPVHRVEMSSAESPSTFMAEQTTSPQPKPKQRLFSLKQQSYMSSKKEKRLLKLDRKYTKESTLPQHNLFKDSPTVLSRKPSPTFEFMISPRYLMSTLSPRTKSKVSTLKDDEFCAVQVLLGYSVGHEANRPVKKARLNEVLPLHSLSKQITNSI